MTSRADADTLLTGIAVALNSDLSTPKSSFGDQNGINGSDVLLMYTYVGDADLTGSIDGDDYMRIDAGYSSGGALTGYVNGDFDYSGSINADDYWLIDRNYSRQFSTTLAPGPIPGGVAAVPEPPSIGAIALAGCAMLARRQRR
jgi:hypothetical protein